MGIWAASGIILQGRTAFLVSGFTLPLCLCPGMPVSGQVLCGALVYLWGPQAACWGQGEQPELCPQFPES